MKSLAEYVIFGTQDVRSAERRLHPIGRQRQFSDALAGRIGECIYDRGYRRPLRSFAGAKRFLRRAIDELDRNVRDFLHG